MALDRNAYMGFVSNGYEMGDSGAPLPADATPSSDSPFAALQQSLTSAAQQAPAASSNTPAGDAYAALTRDMWNTYVSSFMPYENKLIKFATDRNAPLEAMQKASGFVADSFDAQQGASQRRLQGLGLTLDTDEQKAADRAYGLARSLADVSAQNNARDTTIARQQSVLGNPTPTLPNI